MDFAVGDKVMHPNFGAGKITAETNRELVQGFEHYFVIKVIRTDATAYVPKRKMQELGVRSVMSRDRMDQVLDTLRGEPNELPWDYKPRQAGIEEKLVTRRPAKIAEAISLGRRTRAIVWQNIILALVIKAVFIGLGIAGLANMWMAVIGDMGVALLAVGNAMRVMRVSNDE